MIGRVHWQARRRDFDSRLATHLVHGTVLESLHQAAPLELDRIRAATEASAALADPLELRAELDAAELLKRDARGKAYWRRVLKDAALRGAR